MEYHRHRDRGTALARQRRFPANAPARYQHTHTHTHDFRQQVTTMRGALSSRSHTAPRYCPSVLRCCSEPTLVCFPIELSCRSFARVCVGRVCMCCSLLQFNRLPPSYCGRAPISIECECVLVVICECTRPCLETCALSMRHIRIDQTTDCTVLYVRSSRCRA